MIPVLWQYTSHTRKLCKISINTRVIQTCWKSTKADYILELLSTMPKATNANKLKEARILQQKQKARWKRTPSSFICLQVLGNGSPDSSKALCVITEHQRYMFNCGEGTQRLAYEHKMKLGKMEHIFLTYKNWANIGGLLGVTLTIQDIGVPKLTLHGPPEIENLYHMSRSFLGPRCIELEMQDFQGNGYQDSSFQIDYVPLYRSKQSKEDSVTDNTLNNLQQESINSHAEAITIEVADKPDVSVAYICKPHSKLGHLLLEKCVEFGVTPGPLFGELKSGKDITLENGKLIRAVDVQSAEEPGPIFIVIECPHIEFLDSLLDAKQFIPHQSTALKDDDVAEAVIHFTPSDVMKEEKYRSWMNRFPSSTHHLVLNDATPGLSTMAVHRAQHMLHLLHPNIFPLLNNNLSKDPDPLLNQISPNIIHCKTKFKYNLRPKTKVNMEEVLELNSEEFIEEAMALEGFPEALENLQSKLKSDNFNSSLTESIKCYPEIIFLGTGSSIPNKARNVSAILLQLSPGKYFMLDCGEGTYNQLIRLFGHSQSEEILRGLSAVFVSHMHADHHLGLTQLLLKRRQAFHKVGVFSFDAVHLLAPNELFYWLKSFHQNFQPILDEFRFFGLAGLHFHRFTILEDDYKAILDNLDLKELKTVGVIHCKNAFGVVITLKDGWKLVYSGDTKPCQDLIDAGKDCDLLIHEATLEDELIEDAHMKMHSTTSQAIEIGQHMKAKFTLLTHFSQRYAKIPIFNENFNNNVGIAFDNMRIQPKDLPIIPLMIPALKCLYNEHYEYMQERTAKRLRQKEREEMNKKVKTSA